MAGLTEEQIGEYREAFSLFDRVGDGKIECDQIGCLLRSLGLNPTGAEVKKIEKDVDPKGIARVSFEEFLPIYTSAYQKKQTGSADEFVEGLRVFDRDGTGTVLAAELRSVLMSLGEKLSDEEVTTLFAPVDDSSGHINYEELVKMVLSG
ncbi:myosin-2 essential light chain isoform X2 [Nematostella vectensis]|uniref:myosin-2 essential light chain isoform X2 n=1 Tax=Nematostella vectensis TaxID=45351 RepID=UPI0020774F96|nr:myosin-2 essential light chain isoform X2 [Nematostella vectensis]